MKPKHRRLVVLLLVLCSLSLACFFVLQAFRNNIVFFYSPTEIITRKVIPTQDQIIRIGGLVEKGSIHESDDHTHISFVVTDLTHRITVSYTGLRPNLFREGQGVVVKGSMTGDTTFQATELLAKHDENYMPREVVDALKASGKWKEGER